MVDWLCMNIAIRLDKEFAAGAEAEQVVLEVVVKVDRVNEVNESNEFDKLR